MSVNKHKPHILVLPEDDANRQIANGFVKNLNVNQRAIQILPIADGWKKVIDQFTDNYVSGMRQFLERSVVLLIDFDQRENRLEYVKQKIPEDLQERVFILGVQSNPEKLRNYTQKTFETIGETLANNCADNTNDLWSHDLLKHNETELERMREIIKPFLFI